MSFFLINFSVYTITFSDTPCCKACGARFLIYYDLVGIYKLCHTFLPYQNLGVRIRQAKSAMDAIETWLRDKYEQMNDLIKRGYNGLYRAHRTRYKRMLDETEKIKVI